MAYNSHKSTFAEPLKLQHLVVIHFEIFQTLVVRLCNVENKFAIKQFK